MTNQNAVNRISLPSEFYDITNAKMLVAPTPQLPYAQCCITALGKSLEVPTDIANAGRESLASKGADYLKLEDMQLKLNDSPLFTEMCVGDVDFTKTFGATMRFNRPAYDSTTYTLAARTVSSNTTITTTPVSVSGEQTALTLVRIGGPYDSTNSCVGPIAVEAFDANMSVHKLVQIVGLRLQYDFHRTLDGIIAGLLDLGTATYAKGASADSDFTSVDAFPLDVETIRRAEATLNRNNVPVFSDGFRVAVLDPIQVKQVQDDTEYQRQAMFHSNYNTLFPNYVKTISKTHIFQSSTLTNTSNGTYNVAKGHMFGPGVILTGMGRPPRVRTASDDNYEETPKVLWLGDMAFGLADSRFCLTLRSATGAA